MVLPARHTTAQPDSPNRTMRELMPGTSGSRDTSRTATTRVVARPSAVSMRKTSACGTRNKWRFPLEWSELSASLRIESSSNGGHHVLGEAMQPLRPRPVDVVCSDIGADLACDFSVSLRRQEKISDFVRPLGQVVLFIVVHQWRCPDAPKQRLASHAPMMRRHPLKRSSRVFDLAQK